MSNKFFVWKKPICDGIDPEWIEITGKEFYMLIDNPENAQRRFIKEYFDPENKQLGFFVLESTKENFNKHEATRKKRERSEDVLNANMKRHRLSEKVRVDEYQLNSIPTVVSFDAPVTEDEELSYHDIVPDVGDNEEKIVEKLLIDDIYQQTRGYSESERQLLDEQYFNNTANKSEREIAKMLNIPTSTYNRKKEKIIKKLQKKRDI